KYAADILDDRMSRRDGGAEISRGDVAQVVRELHGQRLVETELQIDRAVGLLVRLVADDRDDRVHWHHAADEESERREPQQGEGDGGGKPCGMREAPVPLSASRCWNSRPRPVCA